MGPTVTDLRGAKRAVNQRIDEASGGASYAAAPLPAVAAFAPTMAPMQVSSVVDTIAQAIAPFLQLFLTVATVLLVFAFFVPLVQAAFAIRSSKSSKQNDAGEYAFQAVGLLVAAAVVGLSPTLLSELGVEYMNYIEPVDVITGGN